MATIKIVSAELYYTQYNNNNTFAKQFAWLHYD